MIDEKALRRIQSAPDAKARQVYTKDSSGRKTLDRVVWSSQLLKAEITMPCGIRAPAAVATHEPPLVIPEESQGDRPHRTRQDRKE